MATKDTRGGRWQFFLSLIFLFTGCSSGYRTPTDSTAAYVTANVPLWITRIDGKAVSRMGITGEKQFALSPGNHFIELQYLSREPGLVEDRHGRLRNGHVHYFSKTNAVISFVAEARRHYYVHDGRMDDRWIPFISEKPVATFLDLPVH
jgi:hypothetical protein